MSPGARVEFGREILEGSRVEPSGRHPRLLVEPRRGFSSPRRKPSGAVAEHALAAIEVAEPPL